MKTRLVRPELFSDERLAGVGPYALPLLLGLPCIADRDGRFEDKPLQIKTLILPYVEISTAEFNLLLDQLHALKFLVRYEVGGKRYIELCDFANEQKPHPKEACRNLPGIPEGFEELKEITGNSMKLNEISGNYLNTNSKGNSNSSSKDNNKDITTKERSVTTKAEKPEVQKTEVAPHVYLTLEEIDLLKMKYGAKASEGVQLLSDWIEAKPGQGSWFKKNYSSAFAVLNPKSAWVWRELNKTGPNGTFKSKRQSQLDNWLQSAMLDVQKEKQKLEPVSFFETLVIEGN